MDWGDFWIGMAIFVAVAMLSISKCGGLEIIRAVNGEPCACACDDQGAGPKP
jgi:hypothetical protein